jgi:hypothetical protein
MLMDAAPAKKQGVSRMPRLKNKLLQASMNRAEEEDAHRESTR